MYSLPRRALAKRAWRSVAACPGGAFQVSRCLSSTAASSLSSGSIPREKVGSAARSCVSGLSSWSILVQEFAFLPSWCEKIEFDRLVSRSYVPWGH